jgi:putative sugar O-methyltransferase
MIQKQSRQLIYNANDKNSRFKATIFFTLFGRIIFSIKEFLSLLTAQRLFQKSIQLEGYEKIQEADKYDLLLSKSPMLYDDSYKLDDSFCQRVELSLQQAQKIELDNFDKTDEWERIADLLMEHFFTNGKIDKNKLESFREDPKLYQEIFNDQFVYINPSSNYKKEYLKAIDLILEYHRSAYSIDKCILASISDSTAGKNSCVVYRGKRISQKIIYHSQITSDLTKHIDFLPYKRDVILDIGCGYGGLSRILSNYTPNSCHILLDLPETLILTSYFIKYNFPNFKIALLSDIKDNLEDFTILTKEYDFIIIPPSVLTKLESDSVDLVINSASFGFMQDEYLKYYLTNIDRVLKDGGYFYTLNKEYIDKWGKGFFYWEYKTRYITKLFEFNSKFSYPQWLGQKVKN